MSIRDLSNKTSEEGAVTAVWLDEEENTVVVQHEFVHLSFPRDEFDSFLAALNEADDQLKAT
jgi:hypothetical protein